MLTELTVLQFNLPRFSQGREDTRCFLDRKLNMDISTNTQFLKSELLYGIMVTGLTFFDHPCLQRHKYNKEENCL